MHMNIEMYMYTYMDMRVNMCMEGALDTERKLCESVFVCVYVYFYV